MDLENHLDACELGNNFFYRHETLVKIWIQIFKRAGFRVFHGKGLKTFAQQLGIEKEQETTELDACIHPTFQQKADILVLNWQGRMGWFDVGVAAFWKQNLSAKNIELYEDIKKERHFLNLKNKCSASIQTPHYTQTNGSSHPLLSTPWGVGEKKQMKSLPNALPKC